MTDRYDGLVFAAAGEFVALRRPGRDDADRLDSLAMPLFAHMSDEGKRLAAAVLSEARKVVPEQLIEALALEPLAISASLLISRAEIPDVTLMRVIAARGEGHARIIKMRKSIGEAMKTRIDEFIEAITPLTEVVKPIQEVTAIVAAQEPDGVDAIALAQLDAAETRDALRRMMMRQTIKADIGERMVVNEGPHFNVVARLINLALAGDPDLLATALSDELRLSFPAVRRIVRRKDILELMLLMKAMELGATDSFAILAALRPLAFATAEAIARFHIAFQSADDSAVNALVESLQSGANSATARSA
jgi:uncharacterized protein (DUF2336 family)